MSAGRFRGIDRQRRRQRFERPLIDADAHPSCSAPPDAIEPLEDDLLRLIFTCCHPALSPEARTALTLREVCGLTTEAVAAALLLKPGAVAQRIVRAKRRIRQARIPYEVPDRAALPGRLEDVHRVVYLLFNEGYHASGGDRLTRVDLCAEAIRLARLLCELLAEPRTDGLLALMLLQHARRAARQDAAGDLVPLDEQDRSLWDRAAIAEGDRLLRDALVRGPADGYALQAAIAAVHATTGRAEDTDWHEIVGLYELLERVQPSPVVRLNRAAAIAMRDGPAPALAMLETLLASGELHDYRIAQAVRADLLRRLGRRAEAAGAYRTALSISGSAPERRFLQRRLDAVVDAAP